MKKWFIILLLAVFFTVWLYVIMKIEGSFSLEGVFMAVFLSVPTYGLLVAIREVIRRIRNNEPLVEPRPPRPRKMPLWYRILSKIF